jgi:hypothetical protein
MANFTQNRASRARNASFASLFMGLALVLFAFYRVVFFSFDGLVSLEQFAKVREESFIILAFAEIVCFVSFIALFKTRKN